MKLFKASAISIAAVTGFLQAQDLTKVLAPFEPRQQEIQTEMQEAMKPFESRITALAVEQVSAVSEYVRSNKEAPDRLDAIRQLNQLSQMAKLPDTMKEFYGTWLTLLSSEETVDPRELAYAGEQAVIQIRNEKGREVAETTLTDVYTPIFQAKSPQYAAQITEQIRGSIGAPSVGETVELAFTAMSGKEIDLKDYKGKVVLIDFWATWCGPCVAELPNLKDSYKTYQKQGFEILGISLDGGEAPIEETTAAVEKFVSEHEIAWENKLSGQGWKEELAVQFKVTGIPATFLIGKDGKITATNLRGPALAEAIETELAK